MELVGLEPTTSWVRSDSCFLIVIKSIIRIAGYALAVTRTPASVAGSSVRESTRSLRKMLVR
jgi:hypothetical protein